jgi:hypothetical protein
MLCLGTLLLGACAPGQRLPMPTFPQVEGASEAVRGEFGTLIEAHRICQGIAQGPDELVRCMQGRGYEFIPRDAVSPAPECWELRVAADQTRLPPASCFREAKAGGRDADAPRP